MAIRFDGTKLATIIRSALAQTVSSRHLTPTLAVLFIGDNASSASYIRAKTKAADDIGVRVTVHTFSPDVSDETVRTTIQLLNDDLSVHGIIIQRPVPDKDRISPDTLLSVHPSKDVDAFHPHTLFAPPVAQAVIHSLFTAWIGEYLYPMPSSSYDTFLAWLRTQSIVIIGKGETAGTPIRSYVTNLDYATSVIDSSTPNPEAIIRKSDIIISCTGKPHVIDPSWVKPSSFVVSVGMWIGEDGHIHTDLAWEEFADACSFLTPTPHGIGPVNVAYLMANLVRAQDLIGESGTPRLDIL